MAKRGRPRKVLNDVPVKKMGRPRKVELVSDNDKVVTRNVKKKVDKVVTRNVKVKKEKVARKPYKNPRHIDFDMESVITTHKFLGYCPDCHGMIVSGDLVDGKKTIFMCSCGLRGRVTLLLCSRNDLEARPKSKKDFLEQTILVDEVWNVPDYIPDSLNDLPVKEEWD